MDNFLVRLQEAREKMSSGRYQDAFELIVDQEVQSLSLLLKKIECLIDIGFILRDEKILKYGLYLLEKHGSEVLEVEDLAPFYFLNLANQYTNMITLSSYSDEYFGYYTRGELLRARELYEKALSYDSLTDDLSYEIQIGLARVLYIGGRGVEALEHYEDALRIKPDQRDGLLEKIQLMTEYGRINSRNFREFMKEAWHLSLKAEEWGKRDGEDDHQELKLRGKILEDVQDRTFLDSDEEYPLHSIITNSEEEHQYTMFSLRHNLYLNLCGFCRKCDFAVGDQARLNSSGLIIRPNQKKRYASLAACYSRLCELYRTGRFLLVDSRQSEKQKDYAAPGNLQAGLTGYSPGTMSYYLLRNAFLHGWSLWNFVKDYLTVYWDAERKDAPDLYSLFHDNGKVREEWVSKQSPSLHGVYDLYMDCLRGSRKSLAETAEILKNPLQMPYSLQKEEDPLHKAAIELYRVMRTVILYLGIMHERNELQNQLWSFPRPLYNFFMSWNELQDK